MGAREINGGSKTRKKKTEKSEETGKINFKIFKKDLNRF
jgi:hypothetical protein